MMFIRTCGCRAFRGGASKPASIALARSWGRAKAVSATANRRGMPCDAPCCQVRRDELGSHPARQADVAHQHIGPMGLDQPLGFIERGRQPDMRAGVSEDQGQHGAGVLVVLDHEHIQAAQRRDRRRARAAAPGVPSGPGSPVGRHHHQLDTQAWPPRRPCARR